MNPTITYGATTWTFLNLEGGLDLAGLRITDITRPGFPGRAHKIIGYNANPVQITTRVDISSPSVGRSIIASYKASQGGYVTITTARGTYTNMLVHEVMEVNTAPILSIVGGLTTGGTAILTAQWTVEHSPPW